VKSRSSAETFSRNNPGVRSAELKMKFAGGSMKKMLRTTTKILTLLAVTATTVMASAPKAQAYDEDTHFYGTYAMARYSGIRHEAAMKIALSAQWMDESFISDPTSLIFLPITGVKKRRLLHFPSSRVVGSLNADAQQTLLGNPDNMNPMLKTFADWFIKKVGYEGKLDGLNFMTETEEDHPFASELLMQGLKQGNLMMAAASIHTLEDSYAHAGTPAEQGHAAFWHWPDRPFASMPKYFRMVHSVMSVMVTLRQMLPPEAIDCSLHLTPAPSTTPNCKMTASELAKNYSLQPEVVATVSRDVLKDKEYVMTALKDLFARAVKAKYVKLDNDSYKAVLAATNIEGMDAYTALEEIVRQLLRKQLTSQTQYFDLQYLLTDMGRLHSGSSIQVMDYIDSYGIDANSLSSMDSEGFSSFVHAIAYELLRWKVPMPLTDSHRMEVEDDTSPIREKEMEIRNRGMRALIAGMYGTDLQFLESNSKDQKGFQNEMTMNNLAETPIPTGVSNTVYATYNLREKNLWDKMIFQYLFPDLKEKDLETLVGVGIKVDEYLAQRKAISDSTSFTVTKEAKYLVLDHKYFGGIHSDLKPMLIPYLHDLVDTHLTPSDDNYFYRNNRLFTQYRDAGTVKNLLGSTDVWTWAQMQSDATGGTLVSPIRN
jgi:hypothetical protein